MTDLIVILCAAFFLFRGFQQGLFQTLLGPMALILALIFSVVYYQKTHHLLTSLLIGILGPFPIKILFSFVFNLWNKATQKKIKPSDGSRIAGALVSLLWSGSILILTLIFLSLVPLSRFGYEKVRKDILASRIISLFDRWIPAEMPTAKEMNQSLMALKDPRQQEKIRSIPEYQKLLEDPRVKDILSDEETVSQIQDKNFLQIMNNPKILAIFNDKDMMIKFLNLHKEVLGMESKKRLNNE